MSDARSTSPEQPLPRFKYLPTWRWFVGTLIVTAIVHLVLLIFSGLNEPLGQLVILPFITIAFLNWYGVVRLWVNRRWPR